MAADAKTLISMSLRDQASRQLKQFERNWKSTMGAIEQDGAGGLEDAIGGLLSSGLGKVAGGIASFFAVGKLTQTVTELGQLGAQAQRTQASFGELASSVGQSADAMLQAMRTATAGTVADSELMLSANRAMMLGVADNAAEMSGIMAAAITRGRALGVSASQAVSDVITGIGRMSPQILDNLGIVGVASAFDDYAASLGKTAEQLSEVEKKQALVNAVIASSGGGAPVIDDAAAAFERMDASIQNAKEALGVMFSPAIAAIANQIADAATAATEGMQAQADLSARTLQLRQQLAGTLGATMLTGVDDPSTQQRVLALALAQTQQAQQQAAQEAVRLAENTQAEIAAIYASTPGMSQADAAGVYAGQLEAARAATVELQAQAEQIAAVMGGWIGARGSQEEYNRSLWEGVAAWSAFRTEAQIAAQQVRDGMGQITASAQGGLAGIARDIAAVQGTDAAVGWLRGANDQLEVQIGLWAEAGYSIGEITSVLLPQWLSNLDGIIAKTQAAYTATAAAIDVKAVADGAAGGLDRMAQALAQVSGADRAFAWLDDAQGKIETMIGQWARQGYTIEQITGVLLPNYVATLDQIVQREIQAAEFGAQIGTRIAAGLNVAIGAANTLMGALGSALGFTVEAINGIANSAMPSLTSAASGYVDAMGPDGALGWLQEQKSATEGQIASWMQAGYTVEEIQGVLLPAYLTKLRSANSELKTMGGGVSTVADGFDDLRGKVQSIISGATTLDFGLDPANFLPREDAINENARRLGAIMRDGIAGQDWLEEFKSEVPALWEELSSSGDPKGAAARMLQEFQQGLRPELLDRDMIKARVKAMLLGEENSSALANEIAAELSAELGMSLAQAQQAVAGVMGVGGAAGGMTGGGQVGPDGAAQGSQFVAAWAGMVKSQLTEFENTGKSAGASWGAGFMATVEGGVPGQLIALLVSLVTPGVMAQMAAQGSRTGAQ